MQIYGLQGMGQVADIPGAIAGGQQYKLQKDAIDEKKRLENTTWLAGAAKYGLDNWGQPGILDQLVEEGKRRGIIDPQTQAAGITREGLIKIYQGARTALGGVDPMAQQKQAGPNPTAPMLNYQERQRLVEKFGEQSPQVQTFDRYVRAGRVTDIGGVPTEIGPAGPVPLSTQDAEVAAAAREAQEVALAKGRGGAQAQAEADAPKEQQRLETKMAEIENLRPVFSRAKENAGFWTTGFLGANLKLIPGTPAFDLKEDVDTIVANLGFDRLQRMREESKTGGALGQVAVRELELLQKTVRSLETAQSKEQFVENLTAVGERAERAFAAYEAAMQEKAQMGNGSGRSAPDTSGYIRIENDAQFEQLPSGAVFIGPDGKLRKKP